MNRVLIVSEEETLALRLEESLNQHFQILHGTAFDHRLHAELLPNVIAVAAREDFSYFLEMERKLSVIFPQIPILFLWIESECIRILTSADLQNADRTTVPLLENGNALHEVFSAMLAHTMDVQQTLELRELQSNLHSSHQNGTGNGALQVEYDNFAGIYRFVEQLAMRSGQSVQTLLLTLVPQDTAEASQDALHHAMQLLSQAIQMTLRKNDVLTGCSHSQMLVLLMDADDDGGHLAANRIFNTFLGMYDSDAYALHYDIKPIGAK